MKTILVPKNLGTLSETLPDPNYIPLKTALQDKHAFL